jgi:hypothetical protein
MANHILKDILPEEKIIKVNLHEVSFPDFKFLLDYLDCFLEPESDGDQPVVVYYIDPCFATEQHAGKAKIKDKFYFQYEREDWWIRPGVRAFGRVNGGTAFQGFQIQAGNAVPICHVFFVDKAGSTKNCTHNPIYGALFSLLKLPCLLKLPSLLSFFSLLRVYLVYLGFRAITLNHGVDSGCLLNIHEDERMDSDNWIPLGWIPIIDETKSRRPKQGNQGGPARNIRLFHENWKIFISTFSKPFAGLRTVIYADGIARETIRFIAGLLGYQQIYSSIV